MSGKNIFFRLEHIGCLKAVDRIRRGTNRSRGLSWTDMLVTLLSKRSRVMLASEISMTIMPTSEKWMLWLKPKPICKNMVAKVTVILTSNTFQWVNTAKEESPTTITSKRKPSNPIWINTNSTSQINHHLSLTSTCAREESSQARAAVVSLQRIQESRDTLTSTNYITELLIKLAKTQPSKTIGGHQLYRGSMHHQEALRDTLQQDSEV